MDTGRKGKGKHLTPDDRHRIERLLSNGLNFKAIGVALSKDPTTISKEVKRHRLLKPAKAIGHPCKRSVRCTRMNVCGKPKPCKRLCRNCEWCVRHCKDFAVWSCDRTEKPPYVCNGCQTHIHGRCHLDRYFYNSSIAQKAYKTELSIARQGADRTIEEMSAIEYLCKPLILKGQPLSHIYAHHKDEIGISMRTFYRYVSGGHIGLMNIDMRRVVRYKKRKRRYIPKPTPEAKIGHAYSDFLAFMGEHPDIRVAEADFVIGTMSEKHVLLTLMQRDLRLMLIVLLHRRTINGAIMAFDDIEAAIGTSTFEKLFPVVLTDNDSAFWGPARFESNADGVVRTRMFYCEPGRSDQKGALEKNHEYIRYIIPKGKSFSGLTEDNVRTMMNHINSTARPEFGGKSPMELALREFGQETLSKLGMSLIPPDEVCLKPELIGKARY